MFYIDFGRPALNLYANEEGAVLGLRGEVSSEVRLIMTPKTTKQFLVNLKAQLNLFEETHGEIKEEEEEEEEIGAGEE